MDTRPTLTEEVTVYRYRAQFVPDLEDGGYTVTVPALPGCITHGDTLDDARSMVKEAIQCYIESLEKDGLHPPAGDAPTENEPLEEVAEVVLA